MQAFSRLLLQEKYAIKQEQRLKGTHLQQAIFQRVARTLAECETDKATWQERFFQALNAGFIPGGRIMRGCNEHSLSHNPTLINCFVQPLSDKGFANALSDSIDTLQAGGGLGYDFTSLNPMDAEQQGTTIPSALQRLNDLCKTLTGVRGQQGAQMAVLRIDHPDILAFIKAKQSSSTLQHFNLSVAVSDEFMKALQSRQRFALRHTIPPATDDKSSNSSQEQIEGQYVYQWIEPEFLWQQLLHNSYEYAEPGVLFIDTINRENNLAWLETLTATNPCGEQPLPHYGSCCLGSLNLAAFVSEPFTSNAKIELEKLSDVTAVAVRMLDNVLDASYWPLPQQQQDALAKRRIGLGVTGLGDALAMLGLLYDSHWGRDQAGKIMCTLRDAAYQASVELAREKGPFPLFNAHYYAQSPFIKRLPETLQNQINSHGIRNSHLISIAPTGSISIAFADNVSNGVEPIYQAKYERRRETQGVEQVYLVEDHAYRLYKIMQRHQKGLRNAFAFAESISPLDHIDMVAALTPFVDAAISKTINISNDYPFDQFKTLFQYAWQHGVKGLTAYRSGTTRGYVMRSCLDETLSC